jgi:hypothetical protein
MPSRRKMIQLVLSHAGMTASGLALILSAAMVSGSPLAQAQGDPTPADGLIVIPGADGGPVSLRSGPAADQPVVAVVGAYELVSPLGASYLDGTTRWLTVKTAGNQVGWISEQYVAVVGAAVPAPSPSPEVVVVDLALSPPPSAEAGPPPPALAEAAPPPSPPPPPPPPSASVAMQSAARETTAAQAPSEPGQPLEIEAKLKFPEARGRHQEITIWVTRAGVPVSGATVTVFTEDDEDEPMRVLEPTNVDGRTRREFAIGKEKGSIELVVSAVAPDGGKGRTTATYFRR